MHPYKDPNFYDDDWSRFNNNWNKEWCEYLLVKNGGFGGHFGTANCTPKSSYVDFAKMSPNFGYWNRNAMLKSSLAKKEPEKPRRKFWNFHA